MAAIRGETVVLPPRIEGHKDKTEPVSPHVWQGLYVVCGILAGVTRQLLVYSGGADPETGMALLPIYVGMTLLWFLPGRGEAGPPLVDVARRPGVIVLSILDVSGSGLAFLAVALAGSGIFSTVYASINVITAILSFFFLGKSVNGIQATGIGIVTLGLLLTSSGASQGSGWTEVVGLFWALGSTLVFAVYYILAEVTLAPRGPTSQAIPPRSVSVVTGGFGLAAMGVYVAISTLPRWNELVVQRVLDKGGNMGHYTALLVMQALAYAGMNLGYFYTVRGSGALTTGIIQSLKSVGLICLSAFLFCHLQEALCITPQRILAMILVIGGALLFIWGKTRGKANANTTAHSS